MASSRLLGFEVARAGVADGLRRAGGAARSAFTELSPLSLHSPARGVSAVVNLVAAALLLIVASCGDQGDAAAGDQTPAPTDATLTPAAAPTEEPSSGVLAALLELSSGFEQVAVWGRDPEGVRFEAPNGITIGVDGNIYVTEFRGGHVRKFTPDGELLLEAAGAGAQPGMLANPIGVAVDAEGTIYVSESGMSRVSRFAQDGTFVSLWGSSGSEPGQFRSAMGIAVSDTFEIFVADFGNHRVQVFGRDGTFRRSWGEFGAERGQFSNPIGVQLGPAGNVWVVDSGNERVQVFSQEGELLRVFDDVGPGPQIISLNAAGEFYVSSPWAEGRVRHFSPGGDLLGYVGDSVSDDELAAMTTAEALLAAELSPLRGPHGTSTDAAGAVYVADTGTGIVRKFVPSRE